MLLINKSLQISLALHVLAFGAVTSMLSSQPSNCLSTDSCGIKPPLKKVIFCELSLVSKDTAPKHLAAVERVLHPIKPKNPISKSVCSSHQMKTVHLRDFDKSNAFMPEPSYPPEAVENREMGDFLFKLRLNKEGTVYTISMVHSNASKILEDAARQALAQWVFNPSADNTYLEVLVPISFKL